MIRPYLIGLTGSIGMGKSTTGAMFRDLGADVWDADAAVHRLYGFGGKAVAPIENKFPDLIKGGTVCRDRIKSLIAEKPNALKMIENIVHPLVRLDRETFIARSEAEIVVCDIPLLFETGGEREMDAVVVVSAPSDVQRARVLARDGMTEDLFASILGKQMLDVEKRERADYTIETSSMDAARAKVSEIMNEIRAKHARNRP